MSLQSSSTLEKLAPTKGFYTPEQLQQLDSSLVPSHIAIIMDGNRRWALQRGLPLGEGHYRGAQCLMDAVKAAKELGVHTLTAFGLSTENMENRGVNELNTIFQLIVEFLSKETPHLIENGIRLYVIGDRSKFSDHLNQSLEQSLEETSHCQDFNMVLALNYGGRNEMIRAIKTIVSKAKKGDIETQDITEKYFASQLDTCLWPDPDLLIRTSGEQRLSNFLLWQVSYAEFFPLKGFWPDFSPQSLFEVLLEYQKRERRLGD